MSYDVSALSDYVDEQNFPLLKKTVFGNKSAQKMNLQTGVKSSTALNRLETTITFQDDGCSRSASGDDTISQRNIDVGEIAVHKDFCPKDLEKKALQTQVKAGSVQDEIPFEEQFTTNIAENIAKQLEKAIWQGDTASGDANLNKFDGLIKLIDDSGSAVDGNVDSVATATGVTKSNIEAIVDGIYESIPEDVLEEEDMAIMMGVDNFRLYTQALKDSNLFNYDATPQAGMELVLPGSNIKIYGLNGLNGTDRMFASQWSNLYVGVDLEDEEEDFELWYSKDDRVVKFTSAFKYGTQVAFPDQVVEFSLE